MLKVKNLYLCYPGQSEPIFQNLTFELKDGELLWLTGPNGCGKTSLLNCISGIIPQRLKAEFKGDIILNDLDLNPIPINERFRYLAYQMSDPDNQIFFPRVEKELSFALENAGLTIPEMKERILQASKDFGLQEFWETEPGKLSRGEKKLLVLAFCSAQDTPLYLLDEPTSALSGESILKVKNWLIKLLSQGKTVIMVEHNPNLSSLASQILDLGL